ncbi:hypothetical protein [Synechococcus phage S-N03]|uniref:Uncharacterized protein n=1 Tax=Synechococcus phage S-N03 TaxID=2718943 RepID=A0A6G8R5V6_9CAUD|nr:hypothetical protein PQC09_gp129 [Synechococcus phage S-N03]QIN96764.1 hypothetical protein [Synechococcus phage S-N03]
MQCLRGSRSQSGLTPLSLCVIIEESTASVAPFMTLPKFPEGKPFNICPKCGKIYTSWISSLAHNNGQCHKVKDAREHYDFTGLV